MNYLDKTKEELIRRLKDLQQEYDSLTAAFEKDIIDRKEAEDELKGSKLLLRSSIESSKDMIILSIDKHYQYLFFNSYHHVVMLNTYGIDVKLGMNLLECITTDEDREKAKKNYDRALNGESHITVEEYGDINRYYYETRYNPILNDKHEVIGATAFSANVTEHKLNELLLLEKTQKIASQNEEYVQINEELTRINKELLQAKETVEESEKKYKLLYDFNPMPMSIFDVQTLEFLSVNEAFCDKYGYTRDEFLNMTILQIRPETEIEKLKQSVSLKDMGITNAGIFLHKKKDGEIIQVEITRHELIFDNRNAKLVLVNDVTEKLKAESVLIETQFKLNEACKLAHIGIWEWEIDTDTVIWTEELYRIVGIEPLLPAPTYMAQARLYAPESWKILNSLVERTLKTSEPYQAELELIRPGGDIRYVKAFGGAKQDAKGQIKGLFGTLQDITERKLAEKALKKSRKLLSETEKIGKVGGWEIDIDTMDTTWTDEVYTIHEIELNSNQNVEKGIIFYTPESRPLIERAVQRAIELGEPFDEELEIITAKGNRRNVHAIGKADLEHHRVYGFFQDITERKRAEKHILRLNRVYTVLSNINQTIVRVRNKQLLLNEVSRIAVDDGGFLMAWIGMVNQASNKVDVVASSGKTTEYLNDIDIDLNNGVRSSGPTGQAIKTGKSVFSNNIETDDKMIPWRENALKKGYRSSITLPIFISGKIIGTYTMYSGETDFFNEDEIKLLDKLAGDISFALEFFESEKKREQAEEKIREKDIQFRKLSANVSDLIFQFTRRPDGTYYVPIASEGIRNIFGCSPEDVLDNFTPIGRVIYPDDAARVISDIEYSAEHLTYFTCEFRVQIPGKEIQWIFSRSTPEKLPDGSITWYGFNADITIRKQAEEVLREREYLLSSSQRAAHVGTWSWKVGDATTYWSDETYRIYGLSPEMGPPDFEFFFEIIHPEDRHKMREWPEAVMAGLHPSPVEFRVLRPDGIYRVIRTEGDVVDTVDGVPTRIAGTAYDITERKQADEEIRHLNERIATATRSAQVGIWDWDVANNLLVWDDQMYALYGLKKDEFAGAYEAWVSGLHPEDREFCEDETRLALQGVKTYDSEFRVVWPDGSIRYLKAKGEVFHDEEKKPIRMLGVNFDITDRKQAEDKIKKLNEELEQRVIERTSQLEAVNKELETFTYSVSHDLKAPLRGIDGYSKLLHDLYAGVLPDEAQSFVSTIRSSTRQMNQLIEDLLEYSRLERSQFRNEKIKISELIDSITLIYKNELETGNFILKTNIPDIELVADEKGLTIALRNLIENALKFSADTTHPVIEIEVEENKTSWIIRVTDNGIGFDMKYSERIFEIFQRLQRPEDYPGTGIGLAMVSKAMQRMQGKAWATSKPGHGSSFYLEIPKTYRYAN